MAARLARAVLVCMAIVTAAAFAFSVAQAQDKPLRGVALVIGNGAYEHLSKLPNPENDADAIEALFSDLGFDSVRRSDRTAQNLRRDLERFAEDAEDADVAVLYYSGHGIEAGGENFLVPVDADISALDAAGEKLVPVSDLIAQLQATVPVVIVMLDACRDNPFPAGSLLRAAPNAEPVPVTAGGLGETRGVTPLRQDTGKTAGENVGTVLAYAAEPGKVALDGDAGANSPYAAAVLRHLSAMNGDEFGLVMRMVAEEVYLKTGGRQRPWVNESLRRLLHFGGVPDEAAGAEGDVLRERRQLLVTISALPDPERRRIEKVAAEGGVPMDAVYGMLKALGQDAPKDPAELDKLLREQTAKVAELFSREQTLSQADPKLMRLSSLTDEALREGAIETAARLRLEVDKRIGELDKVVGDAEAQVKAKRMEFANEYVRSAQIAIAGFDRLAAADYYAKAFEQAERWDDDFAMRARNSEVVELRLHSLLKGDNAALERGIAVGRDAIAISERAAGPNAAAAARVNLAMLISQREASATGGTAYAEAVELVRAALPVHNRASEPALWAVTYHALGHMLQIRGLGTQNLQDLSEAETIYRELAAAEPMRQNRSLWSKLHGNLATVLLERSRLTGEPALIQSAYDIVTDGLTGTDRAALPFDWAYLQQVAGDISIEAVQHGAGADAAANAVAAYRAVFTVFDRANSPALWIDATRKLAHATFKLGEMQNDPAAMEQAARLARSIGDAIPRDVRPDEWALNEARAGAFFYTLYERSRDPRHLREANASYETAFQASADGTVQKLTIAGTLSDTLIALAFADNDVAKVERAATMMRHAIASAGAGLGAFEQSVARSQLAGALYHLGNNASDRALLEEAIALYESMDREAVRKQGPLTWTGSRSYLANSLSALGRITKNAALYERAAAVYADLLPEYSTPDERAEIHTARGGMLAEAAYMTGRADTFEAAVAAYREALPVYDRAAPTVRATLHERLGQVTIDLGVMRNDKSVVAEGRALIASAADLLRTAGETARVEHLATALAKVDGWLAGAN